MDNKPLGVNGGGIRAPNGPTTGGDAKAADADQGAHAPLIPLTIIDAPTQRVYIASAFVACQTLKLYQITTSIWSHNHSSPLGFFLLLDFIFVVAVSRLHTPRLDYRQSRWAVIFTVLAFVDWQLTGGWKTLLGLIASAPVLGYIADSLINVWSDTFNQQLSISEHHVRLRDLISPSHHILGQHTIHILPYSTAAFAPTKSTSALPSCFCLDPEDRKAELSIPIIFNNTEPQFLSYSIAPFGSVADDDRQIFNITISKSDLIRLDGDKGEGRGSEDLLDLELDDVDDEPSAAQDAKQLIRRGEARALQAATQGSSAEGAPSRKGGKEVMYHLTIKKPGRLRLERVLDRNRFDARLSRSELLVVDCPKMGFVRKAQVQHYCPGDEASLDVWVKGLAPLEASYARVSNDKLGKPGSEGEGDVFKISHISSADLNTPLAAEGERADQLALALRGSHQQQKQTLDWAASRNISIPITIDTRKQGRGVYFLQHVRDACGNSFEADGRAAQFLQDFHIHRRPSVVFETCSPNRPLDLLQGGPSREVALRVEGDLADDGPVVTEVRFEGNGEQWSRNLTFDRRTTLHIDKPGTYSLAHVENRYCTGEAGAAWTCTAREVPPPTATIEFNAIQDPCAGPVGVKALAVLSGKPPFKVKYRIERSGRPSQEREQTVQRTREEIEFRPSTEGEVTYTFTGLSDANYANVALDGPSFTQVLHPVAKAHFAKTTNARKGPGESDIVLQSCQGNVAQAQVDFEGVGPFELTYAVRTSGGELLGTRNVKDIQSSSTTLDVEVPDQVAANGGAVVVTLTNVQDSKGCARPLTVPDLSIDVRRTRPGVSFVEPRETSMLEGKDARLPVRLVGEGPWTVHYRRQEDEVGKEGATIEARLDNFESSLRVDKPGRYEIIDVKDRHCPGLVQKDRQTHLVTVRPRPVASFSRDGVAVSRSAKDTLTRPPVCLGSVDSAALDVQGHYPISVTYKHQAPGGGAPSVHSFNAAQSRTSLQLTTATEGRHTYELMQVGDAVYAPASLLHSVMFARLEHTVHPLPFADFEAQSSSTSSKRVALCLGETLSSKIEREAIPSVVLSGTAPFTLEYVIKDALGVEKKTLRKENIQSHTYRLQVDQDDFAFDVTGRWSIELVRVSDANGCERALNSNGAALNGAGGRAGTKRGATMEIEVVESANITPVGTRADYCVGESIDFVLQGSPPWTVEYEFEGRVSRANVKTTAFSRIAEQAGVLRVKSIAHQHNRCQTLVGERAGTTKRIHALPTVHIRGGSHYVEDLREGNMAEIVFRLQGEAPFSFTYQRTQAVDRFAKPQILETHTVTGIEESTYAIQTAEEGTWSVIWLQDKWCAVSIDMAAGKSTPQGTSRKMITQ